MKLIGLGDSFPYGLIKSTPSSDEECHNRSFIRHLSELDNKFTSYDIHALRGAGNEAILYQLYNLIKNDNYRDSFVFMCWSGMCRDSAWKADQDLYHNPGKISYPVNHVFRTESCIIAACSILEKYNIPHCMVSSFGDHLEYNEILTRDTVQRYTPSWLNYNHYNNSLFDMIKMNYLSPEPDNTIMYYSYEHSSHDPNKTNQYIADCLHPSELGHKLIADTLNTHMKQQNII